MITNRTGKAVAVALTGMAAISGLDAAVKALTAALPTLEIVFFRFAGAAVWLALYLLVRGRPFPRRRYWGRHALRGLFMAVTAFLFFYSLGRLPLALATALVMTAPIHVALLSSLFLKERLTVTVGLAVLSGMAGALIIIFGPADTAAGAGGDASAWTAAILAPIAYAASVVLLKSHSADEPASTLIFAQAAFSGLLVLPFAAGNFVVPPAETLPVIALVGFLGAFGFLLFVFALRQIPASVFSLVDYTSLLWAALLGFLLFDEVPHASLWLGGALIILACILVMQPRRRVPA